MLLLRGSWGFAPKLIVADEAVSKLDVSVRAQILNLLKTINRDINVSLVFITHDLSVARFLCNRIAVMYFGRIVELGPTESIFSDPKHPYTRRLLEARRAHPSGDIADDAHRSGVVGRKHGSHGRLQLSRPLPGPPEPLRYRAARTPGPPQ